MISRPAAPAAPAAVSTVTTPNPGTGNTIGGLVAFPTDDVSAVGYDDDHSGTIRSARPSGCTGTARAEPLVGGSPRQRWRGDLAFVDQWIVNGAEATTSYGFVTLLFNCTM